MRIFGDDSGNLRRLRELQLGADADDADAPHYRVEAVAEGSGGELRVRLAGVDGPEAAAALAGLLVLCEPRMLAPLASGDHYWVELIGCRVFGQDGVALGTLVELWDTGGHDVFVVAGEDGTRHLLPAAAPLLREVDPAARRIVVDASPGLRETRGGSAAGGP